ncbi:InlB B-repeat-containing protein, partial [Mobiluncus mulieris]|uniref:InlB B-repeat-containing protein n=1 Tax=Mobiluncus mulieris TaxID=2052 RepID=UPI00242AA8CC
MTITGKATQTKGSVKDLKDLYQVKITADSGNASKTQCAKIDGDGLTLGYEGDAKTGYTFKTGEKPLEFKAGGSAGDVDCNYIIESTAKSGATTTGWTAPGENDKYKLTIKVTTEGASAQFTLKSVTAEDLKTGSGYSDSKKTEGVAFEYAAPGKVTFNAGEGATLDAKDAGGEAAATQIVAPDDAKTQAAKKATPSKDSKQTTLYGWKLTETGASDKQHVGKTYRVSGSDLKLVQEDGTPGDAYTPVDGDVFEAVWGNKAVFTNKAGKEVTAAPVVFAYGMPTAADDIPGGHADNSGEKPCASPEDFEGWAQVKPSKFPATDADGVKGHLLAAEKGVDYEYQAQCKTYQVAAAFQIKKVGATDITKLGTQTIESGNAPALKFKGDGDTEIDLSTVCGPDHYIKNWTKTTKTDTTGVSVADLSKDKLVFNSANTPEGLTYTGECANSQVVFKSSGDLVKNGDVSTLIGVNGVAVDIKDGKVNKPEITVGPTNTAAHKMLLSWKLTKEAGTAVADGKVFTADLSDTIPATGKAYQPKGGDELTAQWGYEVKYLDGAGNPITTEHVTNGNNPIGNDINGKRVLPACPEGIATGKWLKGENLDTPLSGVLSVEAVNAAPSTSFKSQCVTENLAKISFNVGDGVFKKDTAGNIPNSKLENGVLTITGVAGNTLYMPGAEVLEYKPGFEFKGWAKTKPADQEAAKKTEPVPAVVFPETGKTTEYHAIWVKYDKKIKITYKNSSNGLIAVVEGKTINDKNWGPLPANNEYCTGGQKFKEWQKNGSAFGKEVLEPADLTVDGENAKLELNAKCAAAGKSVIWNANGGVIDLKSVNDKVGDKLGKDDKGNETLTHTGAEGAKLVAPSVTKKGMKLWGWATNPDATASERNVPTATVESGTNTVTYYAVWDADDTKPAVPSVTFDANGGKFADGVNPVVEIKDGKVVFEAEPKLDGKVFAGWCLDKVEAGKTCPAEKAFKNEGLKDSVTVYASYAPSFKVTFDLNGGSFAEGVASEAQTDKDGKVAKPADPTLAGKVFSKWCVVPAEGELDE